MFFKKKIILVLSFILFLIPKGYYIYKAHSANQYTKQKVFHSGDETHFLVIAKNLKKFGVYSDNSSVNPSESATWRPPLWPFILSLFYLLTNNVFILILFKSLLEFVLMILSINIFRKFFKVDGLQLIPFFVIFLEPQYIKYSITFLSESITAVLVLLFSVSFIVFNKNNYYSFLIIILGFLSVLCHPVSIFFVIALLFFYGIINLKLNKFRVFLHAFIFIGLFALWPMRNLQTFHKGFYLTASQGAVFSKGWNNKVAEEFNNVDGDLADEGLNLKRMGYNDKDLSVLDRSELLKKSTWNYIKSLSLKEKLAVIYVKLKSNFNPVPMKEKNTFLDNLGIPFRFFYLFVFMQALYLLIKNGSHWKDERGRICLVILSIMIGQVVMSIYTYTGLRFNAIYGVTLLFLGVLLNLEFFKKNKSISLLKKTFS